jgi:hypothetical protein
MRGIRSGNRSLTIGSLAFVILLLQVTITAARIHASATLRLGAGIRIYLSFSEVDQV